MSNNIIQKMTDGELVDHYRDMQHLPVDITTSKGKGDLAFFQAIVREMAMRFVIHVENEEEDDGTKYNH